MEIKEYKPNNGVWYVKISNGNKIIYKWSLKKDSYLYNIPSNKTIIVGTDTSISLEDAEKVFLLNIDEEEIKFLDLIKFLNIHNFKIKIISQILNIPINKLKYYLKKHNIVFSKNKPTQKDINEILRLKENGSTYKEITKMFSYSVGTISRIIKSAEITETIIFRVKKLKESKLCNADIAKELNLTTEAVKEILKGTIKEGVLKNYNESIF